MNNTMLLVICIASFFLVGLLVFLQKSKSRSQNKKVVQLFNNIYTFLTRKKIALSLENIRAKLYNNTFGEDSLIRYKAVLYWMLSWVVGIGSLVFVVAYFRNNLYVTITLMLFCFEIKALFLDLLIGDDTNFLVGIYNYNVELQQAYSLSKDIGKAIEEANISSTNYNMVKRMEEIGHILDDQIAIDEYIQECPNESLKLLALNCSLVNENGDKKDIDGKSVFQENLFYINGLIEAEVLKRRRLEFWLKGLAPLAIIPLLSFSPYEMWVSKTLPITDVFYKTKYGFLVKISITIVAIAVFYIIKSFAKVSKKRNRNEKTTFWEEVFFKVPLIKNIILKISPRQNTPRGYKYRKLIMESGEYTKTEYIYLRKILFSIIGFIFAIGICISVNNITKSNILNNQTKEYSTTLIITNEGQADSTEMEKELIGEVNVEDIEGSYIRIRDKIEALNLGINSDQLSRKIIAKELEILNQRIKYYHIIIALLVSILGYNIPEMSLKLKTKMRKYEMQNEIIIFETIILIFMYHENSTPELILENMSKFADIFKPQVDSVLKEIKKSDMESLKIIVEEIKYKPLLNLVKNLIKAEDIKTKDAFISLVDNRRSYLSQRKEDNKQIVYKSVSKSRFLSLITIPLIIVFYMAGPMMYVSYTQLQTMETDLQDMQMQQENYNQN